LLKSVRQFFQSILLHINDNDLKFCEQYLTINEYALFLKFSGFEKVHAVRTARKMQKIIHRDSGVDERMMVRAALLHDIGRISGNISLFDKVWLKLVKYLMRPVYNRLAEKGRHPESGHRKFYIHKYHGEAAGDFLKRAGTDAAIIDVIARHAQKPKNTDSKELKLLRVADRTS